MNENWFALSMEVSVFLQKYMNKLPIIVHKYNLILKLMDVYEVILLLLK